MKRLLSIAHEMHQKPQSLFSGPLSQTLIRQPRSVIRDGCQQCAFRSLDIAEIGAACPWRIILDRVDVM